MKLKRLIALLCAALLLAGCSGKDNGNPDEGGDSNPTVQESTSDENAEQSGGTPSDIGLPEDGQISDGFTRIAVTFYGDSATQMGLSWYTPYKEGYGNDVEVLEKKGLKPYRAECKVETGRAEYDEDSMYHQTVITGLSENTDYYFRVGDKAAGEWSGYGSFKTGGRSISKFNFIAVTDTQGSNAADAYFSAATMEKAVEAAGSPAFIMHSGDFVNSSDKEQQWASQMDCARDILMNNIIAPAVGNHDDSDHAFWQHFMLEKTNGHKTTGLYYSYDYGNVHFAVLDTNKTDAEGKSYIDDEQLEWLDKDLEAARENGAKWLIVNMHKGLYTVGEHADNEKFAGAAGARMRLGAVLEKHGVNLVIQGHDHCPSVTKPIKAGKVSDGGVVYINTGAAGTKAYTKEDNMPAEYYELFDYIDTMEREKDIYQDFAVIEVSDASLMVTMYEINMMKTERQMYELYRVEID